MFSAGTRTYKQGVLWPMSPLWVRSPGTIRFSSFSCEIQAFSGNLRIVSQDHPLTENCREFCLLLVRTVPKFEPKDPRDFSQSLADLPAEIGPGLR